MTEEWDFIIPNPRLNCSPRSQFGTCQLCYKNTTLNHHHISYFPEEVTFLCPSCHAKVHGNDICLDLINFHHMDRYYFENTKEIKDYFRGEFSEAQKEILNNVPETKIPGFILYQLVDLTVFHLKDNFAFFLHTLLQLNKIERLEYIDLEEYRKKRFVPTQLFPESYLHFYYRKVKE